MIRDRMRVWILLMVGLGSGVQARADDDRCLFLSRKLLKVRDVHLTLPAGIQFKFLSVQDGLKRAGLHHTPFPEEYFTEGAAMKALVETLADNLVERSNEQLMLKGDDTKLQKTDDIREVVRHYLHLAHESLLYNNSPDAPLVRAAAQIGVLYEFDYLEMLYRDLSSTGTPQEAQENLRTWIQLVNDVFPGAGTSLRDDKAHTLTRLAPAFLSVLIDTNVGLPAVLDELHQRDLRPGEASLIYRVWASTQPYRAYGTTLLKPGIQFDAFQAQLRDLRQLLEQLNQPGKPIAHGLYLELGFSPHNIAEGDIATGDNIISAIMRRFPERMPDAGDFASHREQIVFADEILREFPNLNPHQYFVMMNYLFHGGYLTAATRLCERERSPEFDELAEDLKTDIISYAAIRVDYFATHAVDESTGLPPSEPEITTLLNLLVAEMPFFSQYFKQFTVQLDATQASPVLVQQINRLKSELGSP